MMTDPRSLSPQGTPPRDNDNASASSEDSAKGSHQGSSENDPSKKLKYTPTKNSTPLSIKPSDGTIPTLAAEDIQRLAASNTALNNLLKESNMGREARIGIMSAVTGNMTKSLAGSSKTPYSRDVETIRARDSKPTTTKISDDVSFLDFVIEAHIRASHHSCSFHDAVHIKHTLGEVDTDYNILLDMSKLSIHDIAATARHLWMQDDATFLANDGMSTLFSRSVFNDMIRNSCEPSMADRLRESIDDPYLQNDGTVALMTLFELLYGNVLTYKQSIVKRLKKVTLSTSSSGLASLITETTKYYRLVKLSDEQELEVMQHFCQQMSSHPVSTVATRFQDTLIKTFEDPLATVSMLNMELLLANATNLNCLLGNPAYKLFLKAPTTMATSDDIAALTARVKATSTLQADMVSVVSQLAKQTRDQINKNKGKQTKPFNPSGKRKQEDKPKPDWYHDEPEDLTETREFNGSTWRYCRKCTNWTTSHVEAKHNGPDKSKQASAADDKTSSSKPPAQKKQKPDPIQAKTAALKVQAKQNKSDIAALMKKVGGGSP
jgi:hypothetical protein